MYLYIFNEETAYFFYLNKIRQILSLESLQLTTTAVAIQAELAVIDPSCEGGVDGMITITPSGGAGDLSLLWDDGTMETSLAALSAGIFKIPTNSLNWSRNWH